MRPIKILQQRSRQRLALVMTAAFAIGSVVQRTSLAAESKQLETTDLSVEAKRLVRKANIRMKNREPREARTLYRSAWLLHKGWEVAARLGYCEYQLGNHPEAVRLLMFALKHWPKDTRLEERKQAEELLAENKDIVGIVEVYCDVKDASIAIDGIEVARSPVSDPLVLPMGEHTLLVVADGYPLWKQRLHLDPGSYTRVRVELREKAMSHVHPTTEARVSRSDDGASMKWWVLGAGAGLSLVGVAASYFALEAADSSHDKHLGAIRRAQGNTGPLACSVPNPPAACADIEPAREQYEKDRGTANALMITTGIVATGTVAFGAWLLLESDRPAPVQATVSTNGAGLTWSGTF